MTKVLVTGSSGFIGQSLVPALIALGYEVRCAVSKKIDSLEVEQVLINKLEVHSDWTEALQDIDIVIHMAARVHVMDKTASLMEEFYKVNSQGTRNLAEQAAQHKVKRFIFLSTIKVNGEFTLNGAPFTEESSVQPEDPYAQSKLYAERYLQTISQQTGMQIVILRFPLVYGPGVKANFLKMMGLVNKGWPLPFGNIKNKRSFVYIDNLVSAICTVLQPDNAANQVYLVADDEAGSLPDLMQGLAHGMNVKLRLLPIPVTLLTTLFKVFRLNNLNTRLLGSLEVSNKKLKTQLGWIPPVRFKDGLQKTASWYKSKYLSSKS